MIILEINLSGSSIKYKNIGILLIDIISNKATKMLSIKRKKASTFTFTSKIESVFIIINLYYRNL